MTNVLLVDAFAPAPSTTQTDRWFVTQVFERGPLVPTSVTSEEQLAELFGEEVSYSIAPTSCRLSLRDGTRELVINRVVGPNARKASWTLSDGTNPCLLVEAANPGPWADDLRLANVVGGGTAELVVTGAADSTQPRLKGKELDRSGPLTTLQAFVDWAAQSKWVRVSRLAGLGLPVTLGPTAPTVKGLDDRAAITQADRTAAMQRTTIEDGPGQESMPGVGTAEAHAALLRQAIATNRWALLDAPAGASASTLRALRASIVALGFPFYIAGSMPVRWVTAGSPTVRGGTVLIPYSGVLAAQKARQDATGRYARALANRRGKSSVATGLDPSVSFTAAELQELEDLGLTKVVMRDGAVTTMSDRTLADVARDEEWEQASTYCYVVRKRATLQARGNAYEYEGIALVQSLAGDISGELLDDLGKGELIELVNADGTVEPAFTVDAGPDVNTRDRIRAKSMGVLVSVRPMPSAKDVSISLTNLPLGA